MRCFFADAASSSVYYKQGSSPGYSLSTSSSPSGQHAASFQSYKAEQPAHPPPPQQNYYSPPPAPSYPQESYPAPSYPSPTYPQRREAQGYGGGDTIQDIQRELLEIKEAQKRLQERKIRLQEKALAQLEAATEALRHAAKDSEEEEEERQETRTEVRTGRGVTSAH